MQSAYPYDALPNPTVMRLYHQLQKETGDNRKYIGFIQTIQKIYVEEGLQGLVKGQLTSFFIQFFLKSIHSTVSLALSPIIFTREQIDAEEEYQEKLADELTGAIQEPSSILVNVPVPPVLQTWDHFLRLSTLKLISTAIGVTLVYPIDTIKIRLMAQKHQEHYTGAIDAFQKMNAEGPHVFYRGLKYLCVSTAISYGINGTVSALMGEHIPQQKRRRALRVLASFGAFVLAAVASYPFVVIQHRMQVGDTSYDGLSIVDGIKKVIAEEGYFGLWRGLFIL
jgi:hypothetical protein